MGWIVVHNKLVHWLKHAILAPTLVVVVNQYLEFLAQHLGLIQIKDLILIDDELQLPKFNTIMCAESMQLRVGVTKLLCYLDISGGRLVVSEKLRFIFPSKASPSD